MGAALGVAGASISVPGTAVANQGKGDDKGTRGEFGRVYANDVLWRTNVVKVLDEEPEPNDDIYFLHDGEKPIVARGDVSDDQASPFVSESAPGDKDWTGGKWVHYNAKVTDIEAFNEDAPLSNTDEFVGDSPTDSPKEYIEIEKGRPNFGPPEFFICPLNGRA